MMEDMLMHYGVGAKDGAPGRGSGRYPLGSGENPNQRSGDFLSRIEKLKKQGFSEKEIASAVGLTTREFRVQKAAAKARKRSEDVAVAKKLRSEGLSLKAIAEKMGYANDSSVRALLDETAETRMNKAGKTAEILKKEVDAKKMIDVGAGVERELGVSKEKLQEALYILETEGYTKQMIKIPQVTNPSQKTTTYVLCRPGMENKKYIYDHMDEIQAVADYYSKDNGATFMKLSYPASLDSKRVSIRYGDEGGTEKDGVIEIRRGVRDLDLGNSHYAQVRILVDGTHYLKGMAMYSDDLPPGTDIMFNTNKKSGTDKFDVMKKIKTEDPDNPFGAAIKANGQSYYLDKDGKEKLSPINKLKEEGDWDTMSRNLSSQFLSKQPLQLIKKQLSLTYADKVLELDEIKSLTNPTIKRKLLEDFADECDSAAVHLKAAALPRQSIKVILPVSDLKETEVYAPSYRNGEQVALVRYPHGGTFEIPVLTVNNKHASSKRILGPDIRDAIGISSKVAERLSGADFDGDQVVAIPLSDKVRVKSTPALKGLEGFNAKETYAYHDGMKVMSKKMVGKEMGKISNLITDMTLQGAPEPEIARAVRHSMVVIDAEKHKLDYKQSEIDNGIAALKRKYQSRVNEDGTEHSGGASTLLSKRKQDVRIAERRGSGWTDPDTGRVIYKESGRHYIDPKTGKTTKAMDKVRLLSVTEDLHSLSSGTPQENVYADYGNKVKALANEARKESLAAGKLVYSSSAKKRYHTEVETLNAKLHIAELNAPKERQAQAIANSKVKAMKAENPDMTKDEIKKYSNRVINEARNSVNASSKDARIQITDKEWEAIQAGAITNTKLNAILRYADSDAIRQRATPRTVTALSQAQINKISAMRNSGYTISEIADALGKSPSTVSKYLN